MSSARYAYRVRIADNLVNAVLGRETQKVYRLEEGRMFHREELNGSIELLRSDFNTVWANELETELDLTIERRNSLGTYDTYMSGKMTKLDGNYDEDQRRVRINPEPLDRYNKILGAMDKEYDLVKDMEIPRHKINYKKQPLVQIVFPHHNILYQRVGVTSFLTDLGVTYTASELEDFGFRGIGDLGSDEYVYIPGNGSLSPDVSGLYQRNAATQYTRTDNAYRISRVEITRWTITDLVSNAIVYRGPDGTANMLDRSPFEREELTTLDNIANPGGTQCAVFPYVPMQRILTDATTVDGDATLPLPTPDIGDLTFEYDNYIDQSALVNLYITIRPNDSHTVTPTRYGRYAADALHFADEYFLPDLNPFIGTRAFTVMQPAWREYAVTEWLTGGFYDNMLEATTDAVLDAAYKIQDVWRALIQKADPLITFMDDINYSRFLFDSVNPLTSDAQAHTHFITPKSNIIVGDYDNAATKAIITLGYVDELLKYGLNLHWHIDSSYSMHIEHLHYYKNGKSYTNPIIANDLTVQLNPANQLEWAYRTKKYRYKKEILPERYQYSWMDDVSDLFDGYPIEPISNFVQRGNVEQRQISNFSSDLDFAQAAPDLFSKDGFFVLAAEASGDDFDILFTDITQPGFDAISTQNGYWSFIFLHENFHRHYLPSQTVKLNDEEITATTVIRAKEQEVVYPSPIEPDPMRLVITSIGTGEIERMEVNLMTRAVTIKVNHDLDFDNPG